MSMRKVRARLGSLLCVGPESGTDLGAGMILRPEMRGSDDLNDKLRQASASHLT